MARLSDICLKIGSGATPTGGKSAYLMKGISLIRSQNVLDISFAEDGLAYISDEQARKLQNVEILEGDILLNITGDSVARVCIVPNHILPARVNQHVAIIRVDKTKADNNYILYSLIKSKKTLLALASAGSTRNALTKKMIEEFEVFLPSLAEQKRIASILSSLDDKIAVNRRINANLEAQAQALFKSWFVDFTPFKDQPFVDSELGPIPQGWKVVSLDEVCLKITDGSHFSPKDNPKEKIPMLSVKDMRKHGFDYQSCKHITESDFFKLQKNDCVPHVNDLLVAKDGSYLKEIFLCKKEIKQAILSSIAIFRPNTKLILPEYLLHYLKQPQVLKDVRDNYVSGSAVPRIVLKDFKKLKLCIPPMNSISTYRELLKSIEQLLLQKTEENQRLAALRDTLLPKLMSGEIKL